jgi:tetratricopeptide (TPR) repeat protein
VSPFLALLLLFSAPGAFAAGTVDAIGSGEDRYRQGDFTAALGAAEFALEERPGSPSAMRLKARSLIGLRRFSQARATAIAALKRDSNDVDALKSYAFASLHGGAFEPARNSVTHLRRIAPNDAQVYVLDAVIAEKLGSPKRVAENLRWAVRLDPKRFTGLQEASKAGMPLFDPNAPASHLLLSGIKRKEGSGVPWRFVILGLIAIAGVGTLFHFFGSTLEEGTLVPEPSPVGAGASMTSGEFKNPYAEEKPLEKLLANRYRLDYTIGRGGMGKVWEGIDRGGGDRKIAVKQMTALSGEHARKMRELYLKEAKLLEGLQHPNIVRLLDTLDLPEGVHLVFEFVSGKTLQQLITERRRLPWPEIKAILIPAARGLAHAHKLGLVHRDLKPANIMIGDDGGVRLMDFGVARNYSEEAPPEDPHAVIGDAGPAELPTHRTTTLAGTPAYRCPESTKGIVSERTDVFSIGTILYEALTGELPYGHGGWTHQSPKRRPLADHGLVPPPGLIELVNEMLRLDHRKRLPSAQEFVDRAKVI